MSNFDDYRLDIKNRYNEMKEGELGNYLRDPNRSSLRDLCVKVYKNGLNAADREVFNTIFKLDQSKNEEITIQTYHVEYFRTIQNFFVDNSNLQSREKMNLIAILVDFQSRPYTKYRSVINFNQDNSSENQSNLSDEKELINQISEIEIETEKEEEKSGSDLYNQKEPIDDIEKEIVDEQDKELIVIDDIIGDCKDLDNQESLEARDSENKPTKRKFFLRAIKNKTTHRVGGVFAVLLSSSYIISGFIFPNKDCMVWKMDHYEAVNCDDEIIGSGEKFVARNDELIKNMRKVNVCDTTTFFKYNKPVLWYGKSAPGGDYEFFSYPGRHPITDKALKDVTGHIVSNTIATQNN